MRAAGHLASLPTSSYIFNFINTRSQHSGGQRSQQTEVGQISEVTVWKTLTPIGQLLALHSEWASGQFDPLHLSDEFIISATDAPEVDVTTALRPLLLTLTEGSN